MTEKPFCPECDSAHITPRTDTYSTDSNPVKWYCKACDARFNDPVFREPGGNGVGAGSSGMAKELADMDPDDL